MESRGLMAVNRPTVHGLVRALIAFMTAALVACGGGGGGSNGAPRVAEEPVVAISGRVALQEQSLEGAKISLGRIDVSQLPVTENVKGKVIVVDIPDQQPVVGAGGDISFQAPAAAIQDGQLFSVAVTCEPVSENCPFKMPLHAVMSGARLKQGDWIINITTEIAYQRLAYYVAARFSEADLKQEMDTTAKLLLRADVDGVDGIDYEDLLRWDPAAYPEGTALLRPAAVAETVGLLQAGVGGSALQVKTQEVLSPVLGSVALAERGGSKVRVYGAYAYVALYGMGLQIFDVSDPANPIYLSTLLESLPVTDFVVSNGYAFLINYTAMHVYDVRNPAIPVRLYSAETRFPDFGAYEIQVEDNYAYICKGDSIQLVDIHDPLAPVLLDELWKTECTDLIVKDGKAIVSQGRYDEVNSVHVYDLTNPVAPVELGILFLDGRKEQMCVHENYIAIFENVTEILEGIPTPFAQLNIAEISESNVVGKASSLKLSLWTERDMYCDDGRLYILADQNVLSVGVGNIYDPQVEYSVSFASGNDLSWGSSVFSDGKYIYVGGDRLNILADTGAVVPVKASVKGEYASGAGVMGLGKFYYLDGRSYLKTLDISDPVSPVEGDGLKVSLARGWHLSKDRSYIFGQGPIDLSIFEASFWYATTDVSGYPSEYHELNLPFELKVEPSLYGLTAFGVQNSIAYFADASGIVIFDVTDPAVPIFLSRLDLGGASVGMKLAGDYAYLRGFNDVYVINVRNPLLPTLVSSFSLASDEYLGLDLEYHKQYLYLAGKDASVVVVDLSKPEEPSIMGSLYTPKGAGQICISGRYMYLAPADSDNSIQIVDLIDPASPVLLGEARTKGQVTSVSADSSHLYATTTYGIEILPLVPPN